MCMGVNKLKFFVLSIMDDNCEDLIEQKKYFKDKGIFKGTLSLRNRRGKAKSVRL